MPYFRADDRVRIYFEEHGAGTPLVLAYGIGGNADLWDVNIEALATRREPVWLITSTHGLRLLRDECGIESVDALRGTTTGTSTPAGRASPSD